MAMPTVPPIVLTYKSEMNFTKAQPRAPEEAESTGRRSHILEWHSSLQSNEGDLKTDQQLRV